MRVLPTFEELHKLGPRVPPVDRGLDGVRNGLGAFDERLALRKRFGLRLLALGFVLGSKFRNPGGEGGRAISQPLDVAHG